MRALIWISCTLLTPWAHAQFGRGQGDFSTDGADAARSNWVRTDPKISPASLQKPGFALVWKVKLDAAPTVPVLLTGYIGYRGFRSLGYTTGKSGRISALDTDLGRIEWQKQIPGGGCGVTANATRMVSPAFPAVQAGRGFGGGRGGAAKSGVGEPGEGAVTLAAAEAAAARAGAAAPPPGRGPGRGPGGPPRRMPNYIYTLSSDGMLHSMYVSNGEEPEAAIPFLPANSSVHGLIVVGDVAYAAASNGCSAAPNTIWALDIENKKAASWKPGSGGVHVPAIAPDGTVYVTTTGGAMAALEAKTLAVKGTYTATEFTSAPVLFQSGDKTLVAAASKDGRVHILDTASMTSPVATPQAASTGDLASWQDASGTRWILAPQSNAIAAWKMADNTLQPGWTADVPGPFSPIVVNGVVFALSHAGTLHALDGTTGKELWNSGKTIPGPAAAFSGGGAQIYVAAADGTLYTFGFPMEH